MHLFPYPNAMRQQKGSGLRPAPDWRKPRLPLGGRPFISSWKLRFPGSLLLLLKKIHYSRRSSTRTNVGAPRGSLCASANPQEQRNGYRSAARKVSPGAYYRTGSQKAFFLEFPPEIKRGLFGAGAQLFEVVSFHQVPYHFRMEPFPLDQIRSGAWRFSCSRRRTKTTSRPGLSQTSMGSGILLQ